VVTIHCCPPVTREDAGFVLSLVARHEAKRLLRWPLRMVGLHPHFLLFFAFAAFSKVIACVETHPRRTEASSKSRPGTCKLNVALAAPLVTAQPRFTG